MVYCSCYTEQHITHQGGFTMNSITSENAVVNGFHGNFDNEVIHGQKWTAAKVASRKMAARLYAVGLNTRAARMWTCGEYLIVRQTADGLTADAPQLCRDRLCPVCSWRLSRRRFAEMMAVFNAIAPEMVAKNYTSTMLTLTIRNMALPDLHAAIDGMSQAWHNLIRREAFRQVAGWARSLEITYNAESKTYHPHMHIILIWEKYDDSAATAETIRQGWKSVCKLDYTPIIDIRPVYSRDADGDTKSAVIKSALEAFKYSVKPDSAEKIPQADLFEFAAAIKGVRFVSYGKAIKRARSALGFKNEDCAEEMDTANALPDETVAAIMAWNGTSYTRAALTEGKWRLNPAEIACAAAVAAAEGGDGV